MHIAAKIFTSLNDQPLLDVTAFLMRIELLKEQNKIEHGIKTKCVL